MDGSQKKGSNFKFGSERGGYLERGGFSQKREGASPEGNYDYVKLALILKNFQLEFQLCQSQLTYKEKLVSQIFRVTNISNSFELQIFITLTCISENA